MAFPDWATVVDDFNRAELGGDWAVPRGRAAGFAIVGNELVSSINDSVVVWTPSGEFYDGEVYIELDALSAFTSWGVCIRFSLDDPDAGYLLHGSGRTTRLFRADGTQLGASADVAWAAGDLAGIKARGTTVEAHRQPAAGAWELIMSRTDATTASGHAGVYGDASASNQFDGFALGLPPVEASTDNLTLLGIG